MRCPPVINHLPEVGLGQRILAGAEPGLEGYSGRSVEVQANYS
jgi:hypothetical protein